MDAEFFVTVDLEGEGPQVCPVIDVNFTNDGTVWFLIVLENKKFLTITHKQCTFEKSVDVQEDNSQNA